MPPESRSVTGTSRSVLGWLLVRAACVLLLTLTATAQVAPCAEQPEWAQQSRQLLQTGRYEEALAVLEEAEPADEVEKEIKNYLEARCFAELGRVAEAIQRCAEPAAGKGSARLAALRAELLVEQGKFPEALAVLDATQRHWPDDYALNWQRYRALRSLGRHEEADRVLKQTALLVAHDPPDEAEQLLYAGHLLRAYAERHLRDAEQAQALNRVLNDFYDGAYQQDPLFWQARYASGLLFLAKYRSGDADRDLREAVRINPSAAPVYVALGELALNEFKLDEALEQARFALELVPTLADAHALAARVYLAQAQPAKAIAAAREALKQNPAHWAALACLGAAHWVSGRRDAIKEVIAQAERVNPAPVAFYHELGRNLEDQRVFRLASHYLERALQLDEDFNPARAALGMLLMRIGREEQARELLEEAFARDPFSVRIKNTLEVLDVLDSYATIRTKHLVLRVDPKLDRVLGYVAAWYLEDVFQRLAAEFGYVPKEPVLIEVFNRAKGHSGHEWFSARTIGLPWIGTVGACTGKVVAMVSPSALRNPFNWGRVLRHELTHAITLQQTDFNITHWFTEALAVRAEGFATPSLWEEVLIQAAENGDLLDLSTINAAFIRIENRARWAQAYYQSKLYLDYMIERFGQDAPARLLAAYAAGHRDPRSVEVAFHVTLAEFEQGYRDYIDRTIKQIKDRRPQRPASFLELEKRHQANPDDPDTAAELALAYYRRRGYRRARDLARAVLRKHPQHAVALYVLARLYLKIGEDERAEELLWKAFNPDRPDPRVLLLLADRATRARDLKRAKQLYELGARRFPGDDRWYAGLARVALLAKDSDTLKRALTELATRDPTDLAARRQLAALARAAEDWQQLKRWAWEVALVKPTEPRAYEWLREAYLALKQPAQAARATYALALLQPAQRGERMLEAARLLLDGGRRDEARKVLTELLTLEPMNAEARELLSRVNKDTENEEPDREKGRNKQ